MRELLWSPAVHHGLGPSLIVNTEFQKIIHAPLKVIKIAYFDRLNQG